MAYLPNARCWHEAFLILDQKWLKWRTLSHTLRSSKLTPTVVLLKSMRYVPSVGRELHDKYFWKDKSSFLWSMHKAYWRRKEGSFFIEMMKLCVQPSLPLYSSRFSWSAWYYLELLSLTVGLWHGLLIRALTREIFALVICRLSLGDTVQFLCFSVLLILGCYGVFYTYQDRSVANLTDFFSAWVWFANHTCE